MVSEEKVEQVLKDSEEICKCLNLALTIKYDEKKGMDIQTIYYAVARFAAQFISDIQPVLGDDIVDSFFETVRNILQAYEDEGKDETHRILKYNVGNPSDESETDENN